MTTPPIEPNPGVVPIANLNKTAMLTVTVLTTVLGLVMTLPSNAQESDAVPPAEPAESADPAEPGEQAENKGEEAPEGAPGPGTKPPEIKRVENIGDARWSESLGWVAPSHAAAPAEAQPEQATLAIPALRSEDDDLTLLRIGPDFRWLNPTNNDGETADEGRMLTQSFYFGLRREWRRTGRLVGGFIDTGFALGGARRKHTPEGTDSESSLFLFTPELRFFGGVDFGKTFWSVGPFAGLQFNAFIADYSSDGSSNDTISGAGIDSPLALVYGIHGKLRLGKGGHYLDPSLFYRSGKKVRALNFRAEGGLPIGESTYLGLLYDQRLSASGSYTIAFTEDESVEADAKNLGEAFAISAPVERRIVVFFGFVLGRSIVK